MAKYLSTFSCVLIFFWIDSNQILFLRIATKWIKLIRTNTDKLLQFTQIFA